MYTIVASYVFIEVGVHIFYEFMLKDLLSFQIHVCSNVWIQYDNVLHVLLNDIISSLLFINILLYVHFDTAW